MMETIVCKCRVITPMFSSGADQTGCEIRVPEIKAAMRFWWRAAHSNLKLEELKEREALIFGGSGDEEARKSSFTMRVEYDQKDSDRYTQDNWNRELIHNKNIKYTVSGTCRGKYQAVNLFDWLAFGVVQNVELRTSDGQFVFNDNGKPKKANLLQRNGIRPGTEFKLSVCVDSKCRETKKKEIVNPVVEVKKALELFSCFGSLGAKSRNGFGRVVIEEYKSSIKDLCLRYSKISELPEYTAFSNKNFVSLFKTKSTCKTWHEALFQIGKAYREARVGEDATKGLCGDHHTRENRQYIALPLTVKDDSGKREIELVELDRMAKQFFMIVEPEYKNGKEEYRGYILHLPFDFKNAVKNYKQEFSDNYDSAYIEMCTIFSENSNLEEV